MSALAVVPAQADTYTHDPNNGCPVFRYGIPWGLEQVSFDVIGEAGQTGPGSSGHGGGVGGEAGEITGRLPVQVNETLNVDVATDGAGNSAAGSGGAASSIYNQGADNCTGTPLVVAAGGGGGGGGDTFGPGGTGGDAGAAGNPGGSNEAPAGGGGSGATPNGGGAGGADGHGACGSAQSGGNGGPWNGGDAVVVNNVSVDGGGSGGYGCSGYAAGGGGGGGYYGGGGGGGSADDGGGGGGGGSSWADPSATQVTTGLSDAQASVTINPAVWATGTTISSSNSDEGSTSTSVTYTATVTSPPPAPADYSPVPNTPPNPAPPSLGTVDFVATQGSTTIDMGSAPVSGGTASLPYTLPPGVWSVVGTYSGGDGTSWSDTGFTGSTSSAIAQTMGTPPAITTQPVDSVSSYPPGNAHFSAAASGDPAPKLTWQDLNGGVWTTIGTGPTLDLLCEFCEGQYRVVASNILGSATSDVAGAFTNHAPVVQTVNDVTAPVGGSATFTAIVTAYPAPTVQWQVSTDGGSTWTDADPSRTTVVTNQPPNYDKEYGWQSTLTFNQVVSTDNGTKVRATVSNTVSGATQSVTSNAAALHLTPSCIVANPSPANYSHCAGANLAGLDLQGIDLSYGDYTGASFFGDNLDGSTWLGANATGADLIGATVNEANFDFATLTDANLADDDFSLAYIAEANVTGTLLMPSDIAVYTTGNEAAVSWATPPTLGTQDFSCALVSGSTSTPVTSGDTFPLDTTPEGTTVTCYVSNILSSPAQGTFHVHVLPAVAPAVTQQPSDQTVFWQPGGYTTVFTAAASGTPSPTVQWQLSTDGGNTWSDIAGASSTELFVNDPPYSASGSQYRAVFTNMAGTVPSDPATLQVDPQPITVATSGSQTFGDASPTFAQNYNAPPGETVVGTYTCADIFSPDTGMDAPITPDLPPGSYLVDPTSCSGLTLSPDATDYSVLYRPGFLTVSPATITVNVSGTWTPSAGPPVYTETDNAGAGVVLPSPSSITCRTIDGGQPITPQPGTSTLDGSSCNYTTPFSSPDYTVQFAGVTNGFVVTGTVHVVVAGSENYGGTPTFSVLDSDAAAQGVNLFNLGDLTCTAPAPASPATYLQVGGYAVSGATCGGLTDAPSVPIDYVDGPFTVNPVPLTVTADAQSMTYGGSVPPLTATISGFANEETLATSGVSGAAQCGTTATSTSAPGPYPIVCTAGTLAATNYDIPDSTFVAGTLTVNPAPLTVTADPQSMTYGGTVPALTASISGFVNGQDLATSDVTGAASCSTTATPTSPVGAYGITCNAGTLSTTDYQFPPGNFVAGTLTVGTLPLTVTADDLSMTYGGAVPTPTATITGFVTGQNLATSGANGAPSCTTAATAASPVGTYAITCTVGTLSAPNYDFPSGNFVAGTLTVNPAHLAVTADDKSMIYGGTAPTLTATISGFVNGQNLATSGVTGAPSCTTTVTPMSPVATDKGAITCTAGTLSATNYDFPPSNFAAGTMTVGPAHLMVTADNKSMTYGGTVPTLTATISGFVNGQTLAASGVTGTPSCTTTVTSASAAATYSGAIACTRGTLSAANYDFPASDFLVGTLTVNPAHLTVTADNKSMTYGGAVPTLTATISGFVNGQTLGTSGVAGAPACTTTVTPMSPAATDHGAITCNLGTLSATDYDFPASDFLVGTLTVNPAHLTVTADNKSMIYGGAIPPLTATVSGFVDGQTLGTSGVAGTPSCTTTVTGTSPAGAYPNAITCTVGTLTAPNYDFPAGNFGAGGLTVNPKPLTVTADNKATTYGYPVPALTATISGFTNGQTISTSGVSGAPSCTSPVTSGTGSGTYPITCTAGTLSAHNYSFPTTPPGNFIAGNLTVATHAATVGFTGAQFWSTTGSTANVTLQATVTPGSGGSVDPTKAGVVFDIYSSSNLSMSTPDATCTAPSVSSTGVANCTMSLSLDSWTVVATIPSSNPYYTPADGDPAVVTVYQPTSGTWVTGGGWVKDTSGTVSPSNQHANFGFNVQQSSAGVKGHFVLTFRGADGYDYLVKSNSWNGGALAIPTLTTAGFQGKVSVIVINPTTGLQVSGLGGGNYSFRVDVTQGTAASKTTPATPTTFAISVYNGSGALWHQAGTTAQQLPLGGGNIVVHQK